MSLVLIFIKGREDVSVKSQMPKALKFGLFIVLSFVGLLIAVMMFVQSMPDEEVVEFRKNFENIQRGDSKAKVLVLLGEPAHERSSTFRLGQKEGFEEKYERAKKSNASYYLLWFKGADIVFAVGFNDLDEVVVAESGGT